AAWCGRIGAVAFFPRGHSNALHACRLILFDLDDTIDLADDRPVFGRSHLEQLFDTGEPLRDVPLRIGDTPTVKGAHGELRTRLADALGGDDPHGGSSAHQIPAGQVDPIAALADAVGRLTGERRPHAHSCDAGREQAVHYL